MVIYEPLLLEFERASAMSLGIFAPGLVNGTICYFVIGGILSIVAPLLFARESPSHSKGEAVQLTLTVVWTAIICMSRRAAGQAERSCVC